MSGKKKSAVITSNRKNKRKLFSKRSQDDRSGGVRLSATAISVGEMSRAERDP